MSDIVSSKEHTLNLQEAFDRKINSILGSNKFPIEIKRKLDSVIRDVNSNKNIVDLYSDILSEIPISSSHFQDQCVQFEEHFTPHRKLRQCMLQLQDRLDSLDASKNGYLKNMLKIKQLSEDLDNLKRVKEQLNSDGAFCVNSLHEISDLFPENFKKCFEYITDEYIESKPLVDRISSMFENRIFEKSVELQEAQRALTSSEHLVKDAALKAAHHKSLVEVYKKQVEESGMSFEVSEMLYYVMYFTTEIEKQLRTMGRIDTGTFGVIRYLPDGIRRKVLSNAEFIKNKISFIKDTDDFISKTNEDVLLPKIEGDMVEGVRYSDFTNFEEINILSKE